MSRWLRESYGFDLANPKSVGREAEIVEAVQLAHERAVAVSDSKRLWSLKAQRHDVRRWVNESIAKTHGGNAASDRTAKAEREQALRAELNSVTEKQWPRIAEAMHVAFVSTLLVEVPYLPLMAVEYLAWSHKFTARVQDTKAVRRLVKRHWR